MRGARMDHEARPAVRHGRAHRAGTRQSGSGAVRRRQSGGPAYLRGHAVPAKAPRRGALGVNPAFRSRATSLRIHDERVRRELAEWVLVAAFAIGVLAISFGFSWVLRVMAGLK